MKTSLLLLPLLGFSALMCSCVTYPYPGSGYADGGLVYEPGYVAAYGEPLYVYGGMNYYYSGGRYCYLEHGRPIYVARVPYGASHYRGPSYIHRGGDNHGGYGLKSTHPNDGRYLKGGTGTTQPYPKGGYFQGQPRNPNLQGQPHNPNLQGQPHNPNLQGQPHNPNLQGQPHNPNLQGQPLNPNLQKTGQGGATQNRQDVTPSNRSQKKKDSDNQ